MLTIEVKHTFVIQKSILNLRKTLMNKTSGDFEYKPGSSSRLMPSLENTGRMATGNVKKSDKERFLSRSTDVI